MARLPRAVLPGQAHLVVQRALAGRPAFVDRIDRQTYLGALREALVVEQVQLHAYALAADEDVLEAPGVRERLLAMLERAVAQGNLGQAADIVGYTLQEWGFAVETVDACGRMPGFSCGFQCSASGERDRLIEGPLRHSLPGG